MYDRAKIGAFYPVSDLVEPRYIKHFTKDCNKEDCVCSARIIVSTCAGVSNFYYKDGSMLIQNRNDMSVVITCRKCWKSDVIKTKDLAI
jgi:hypothetical protein